MLQSQLYFWWLFLCLVSALNIAAWALTAAVCGPAQRRLPAPMHAWRSWQLVLSAGYVFGCAFRSAFPVYDVPRICLFDTWLSSVLIGRSIATIAELCFAAQWALLMGFIARATGSHSAGWCARLLLPMIAVAEVCSWTSVLTTSNLGHVAEETFWGIAATMIVISLGPLWQRGHPALRPLILACAIAGTLYAGYMFLVDVPMYWARWVADEALSRPYFDVLTGARDAAVRWHVAPHWETWKSEVLWMSVYFSVGVWLSIALIYTPLLKVQNSRREFA